MKSYHCNVCDFIYRDTLEKRGEIVMTQFEFLPDDWKCPRCGSAKRYFVEMEDDPGAKNG
ncbi:MAG: rubredoxin [Spirochaetales bacterium]|nr:rubredoxin [Spirochaetales bacterium]